MFATTVPKRILKLSTYRLQVVIDKYLRLLSRYGDQATPGQLRNSLKKMFDNIYLRFLFYYNEKPSYKCAKNNSAVQWIPSLFAFRFIPTKNIAYIYQLKPFASDRFGDSL